MADDDSSNREGLAFISVTAAIVIFISILPVLVLDRRSRKPNRSRDAKRTQCLMTGVFISNLLFQLIVVLRYTVCVHCTVMTATMFICRSVLKGINWIFLIHRSKLVQGMSPVLSKKWFEKVFPILAAVLTFGFIAVGTRNSMKLDLECVLYSDSDVLEWWDVDLSKRGSAQAKTPWLAILLDTMITSGLMVLFIVPLYRVYKVDLGVMNNNQLQQRKKLRDLLIWSVVLTFINQVSSTLIFLPSAVEFSPIVFGVLSGIGKCDPPINVWTSWLMVTRNRQFLKQICCCQCASTGIGLRTMPTALTDVPSRTNSLRRLWTKRVVELPKVELSAASLTGQQPIELQIS